MSNIREQIVDLKLEQAIEWHLLYNFYPPKSVRYVQPCVEAVKAARNGDWEHQTNGLTAQNLVEIFGLESLI